MNFFYLLYLIFSTVSISKAQIFNNADLEGTVTGISILPLSWNSVLYDDPICTASDYQYATPDLTSRNGPNPELGISGNPYSGNTFMSGLQSDAGGGVFFHEGIMQDVSGFKVDSIYTINFHQAVMNQYGTCYDRTGSWAIYIDETLAEVSPISYREGNGSYLNWDTRSIKFKASSTTHTIKFLPMDNDPNIKTFTDNGCIRMAIDDLFIKPQKKCPTTVSTSKDTTLCKGDLLSIPHLSSNAYYLWNNNTTRETIEILSDGNYWYTTISDGCTIRTDTLKVTLKLCEIILTMPNLITPNNDGMNDDFVPIVMKGINSIHLTIFNIWGQQVYSTDRLDFVWRPSKDSNGVYYWVIEYVNRKGDDGNQKGWLQVIE